MKQICELSNPSDAITFIVEDVKVAAVGVILLGNGWFGLTNKAGETVVPLMLFGAHEKWLADNGIVSLKDFIAARGAEIADFLDTVCYGNITEREAFDRAIGLMSKENAEEHRKWFFNEKRTSINDIGSAALKLAANLRKRAAGQKADLRGSPPIVLAQ